MTRKKISNNNEGQYERIDFIIKILQGKLATQKDSYNALSTKLTIIVGFAAVLVGGYITLIFDNKIHLFTSSVTTFLNTIGISGLLIVILLLVLAIKTRTFPDPPELETIYSNKAFEKSVYDLKNQVASDMKECYKQCQKELKKIAKWIDYSMILLSISILFILIAAISQNYSSSLLMGEDTSKPIPTPQPKPVSPSPKPGDEIQKGPVQPSTNPGSGLPFGEPKPTNVIK